MKVVPRHRTSGVYAVAGEKTYCEKGHFLGSFARDVHVGAESKPEDFQLAPKSSLEMMACPSCGGQVKGGFGVYFFEAAE